MIELKNGDCLEIIKEISEKSTDMMPTLLNIDSLEFLKTLEDKSIDWIITDPPYGIKLDKWDVKLSKEYFKEMIRVSKNQIIFGWNCYTDYSDILPPTEGYIVWYKQPFLPQQAHCELIWTSLKQKPKVIHYRYAGNCEGWVGNLKVDYKKKSVHKAEKLITLMQHIIETYTKEHDTICDPFMGSGSTGVACINTGRNFIGIELDEDYFNIAKERIEKQLNKLK